MDKVQETLKALWETNSFLQQQLDAAKQENERLKSELERPYSRIENPCFVCEAEDALKEPRGTQSHPINCGWRIKQAEIDRDEWKQKTFKTQHRLKQAIEALEWYADKEKYIEVNINWPVMDDYGERARKVLCLIQEEPRKEPSHEK